MGEERTWVAGEATWSAQKITCRDEHSTNVWPKVFSVSAAAAVLGEAEKCDGGGICLCSVVVIYEEKGVSVCGSLCMCVWGLLMCYVSY